MELNVDLARIAKAGAMISVCVMVANGLIAVFV